MRRKSLLNQRENSIRKTKRKSVLDKLDKELREKRRRILRIKNKVYEKFHDKYSNPYIYTKEIKENYKEEENPTYFGYYKINKLIKNVPCHFLSIYHELNLFFDFQNEFISNYFSLFESHLIIKYSIYNECTFLSNLFPLGKEILFYLKSYKEKIKKKNEKIIEKNLGPNKRKKSIKPFLNLDKQLEEPTINFLNSILLDNENSQSYSDYEIGYSKKKKNKNIRGNDSINSIEHLTQMINKIEEEKKKKTQNDKKLIIIDASLKKKNSKFLIEEFNKGKIRTKDYTLTLKKIHFRNNILNSKKKIIEVKTNENEEKNFFNTFKFKSTFDFITNTKEKTEKEKNKRIIINQCLENIKKKKENEIRKNQKKNHFNKLNLNSIHSKGISDDIIIGINDLYENEREINLLNKTDLLLKRVNKKKKIENDKFKDIYNFQTLLTCPNIYNDNYRLTFNPKTKYKLRIKSNSKKKDN